MEAIAENIGYFTGSRNGYLTGRGRFPSRSLYRPMLSDLVDRIEQRLDAVGLRASAASKAAGLSEDAIRNIQRAAKAGKREGVSTRTIAALAPVLKTTEAWLMSGDGPDEKSEPAARMVRIIGRVGADASGTVLLAFADETFDMAPMPPGGTSRTVALEVNGLSMPMFADDGSLIYFEDQKVEPTPDLLGEVCAVETEDGRVLVKRLKRGSQPGLFDLESIVGATIKDVRLRWAAEITNIVPPRQARRVIVRSSEHAA